MYKPTKEFIQLVCGENHKLSRKNLTATIARKTNSHNIVRFSRKIETKYSYTWEMSVPIDDFEKWFEPIAS